jgi:fatty acid desaturase
MTNEFSVAELRRRFANAFPPNPWIYWSDLLASATIGWVAFFLGANAPFGLLLHIGATVAAIVALLRAAIFIHEIAHLRSGSLSGFPVAWHLLIGLPLFTPSLMYEGSHNDHHRQQTFGTAADPEYASIARWEYWRIAWFVLSLVFVPLLLTLRWGVLGPLSFFVPPLRRLLIERASTLVINPDYRRPFPRGNFAMHWLVQEVAVACTFWGIVASVYWGWMPMRWLAQWYVVTTGILMVNQARTLAAHRYDNNGEVVTADTQLLDSVTLSGGSILTICAAPVGLRFHALHHLLPTVPYHSLGALHRLLLTEFPPDSPYAQTQEHGIGTAVRRLFRHESLARKRTNLV